MNLKSAILTSLVVLATLQAQGKPAVTAAEAAPAPIPAAKEKKFSPTLFVEGTFNFTLSAGLTAVNPNGNDNVAGDWDYDSATAKGFGGGGALGYHLIDTFAIVAHAQYRDMRSRQWSNTATSLSGATDTATYQIKHPLLSLGLGLRSMTKLFFLDAYAGGGLALAMPSTRTAIMSCTTSNTDGCVAAGYFGNPVNTKSYEINTGYNLSVGIYAEMGLAYNIFDNLYISLGGMFFAATITDKDKGTTSTTVPVQGPTTTTSSTGSETTSSANTSIVKYQQESIADFMLTYSIGCRF